MRDHPIFKDPEWLEIDMIDDWLTLFKKHLDLQYNHYLKSIVVDLTMYSFAKQQSSSLFDLTFDELVTLKFCTSNDLETLADWLTLSMFDEETHLKYMLPIGFPTLQFMIETSSIEKFKGMIQSKIEFGQFHKLPRYQYLKWVNLLSMIELVEQQHDAQLMECFRNEMSALCSDDATQELVEGLHEWLRARGVIEAMDFSLQGNLPIPKTDPSQYNELEREFAEARIAEIFDEDNLLTSWGIVKLGLTLDSTQEKFTHIYRKYGIIGQDEVVSDATVLQIGKIMIAQEEEQTLPHTEQEAHLWGLVKMREAVTEYEEAPKIKQEMFTPLRYIRETRPSIMKKEHENNNQPKQTVKFTL